MRDILVWMTLYYLRFWARLALTLNRPFVIGVAGSVGKSSTRNALYAVLRDHFETRVVAGNSETGVPLGILGFSIDGFSIRDWAGRLIAAPFRIGRLRGIEYLIIEMGIDDPYPPKNMSYLLTIVKPDMSIDLNATATHTQQFEKLLKKRTKNTQEYLIRKIAEEDTKIITNGYTKIGIYNKDDENLSYFIEKSKQGCKLLTFGENPANHISYNGYLITTNKTKFSFIYKNESKRRVVDLVFPGILLPQASRESLASVLLAGIELGLSLGQISTSLEKNFTLPKGRSSLFNGIKGSLVIDSSYNSSKVSVLSFLSLLESLRERTKRPIVFVMGDMRELGKQAQQEHEEIARRLVSIVDELYCVGSLTREYVVPAIKELIGRKGIVTTRVDWYKNAVQAALHIKEELPKNAIVLVKGSQNTIYLEEAIKFLLENQSDVKKLTRQEDYWLKIKQDFFKVD